MSRGSVEVARKMLDALANRDEPAWASIVAEKAVLFVPFMPGDAGKRYEGRGSFKKLTWDFFRAWDEFAWSEVDLHAAADDPELVFGTGRSKASGSIGEYENQYCFKFRVKDGMVCEYHEYFNPLNVISSVAADFTG